MIQILYSAIKHIDPVYMLIILSLGYFICSNLMLSKVPSDVRLPIKRINKTWRVLWVTLPFGVLLYYLRGCDDMAWYYARKHIEDLMLTWLCSNAFYELLIKPVVAFFGHGSIGQSLVNYFSRR